MSGGKRTADPARETDHEFKTRMAAEGRAIYIPGKTDEEVRAERAQREKPRPLTLHLSEDQLSQLDTGLADAVELIHDAGGVMDFLSSGQVLDTANVLDILPVLRLSARALKSAEREIAAIDLVAVELRLARACGAKGGTA